MVHGTVVTFEAIMKTPQKRKYRTSTTPGKRKTFARNLEILNKFSFALNYKNYQFNS